MEPCGRRGRGSRRRAGGGCQHDLGARLELAPRYAGNNPNMSPSRKNGHSLTLWERQVVICYLHVSVSGQGCVKWITRTIRQSGHVEGCVIQDRHMESSTFMDDIWRCSIRELPGTCKASSYGDEGTTTGSLPAHTSLEQPVDPLEATEHLLNSSVLVNLAALAASSCISEDSLAFDQLSGSECMGCHRRVQLETHLRTRDQTWWTSGAAR